MSSAFLVQSPALVYPASYGTPTDNILAKSQQSIHFSSAGIHSHFIQREKIMKAIQFFN